MNKGQKILSGMYCSIQALAYGSLLYLIGELLAHATNGVVYFFGMFAFLIVTIVAILQIVILAIFFKKDGKIWHLKR